MEELEPRLLFSADLPSVVFDTDPDAVGIGGLPPAPAIIQSSVSSDTQSGGQARDTDQRRKEVVFIDAGAPNYQQLIHDLTAAADQGRDIQVVVLDSDRDGIEQITEALTRMRDLDAVHVVSHGSDASLQLGNRQLDQNTLMRYAHRIQGWSEALNEDADLLIYGCDLASGSAGQTLIDQLATLTGADVAASDDVTGQAARGGDWELEYSAGDIETSVAFSAEVQDSWEGVLGTTYYLDDDDSGTDTPDAALKTTLPTDPTLDDYDADPLRDPLALPGITLEPSTFVPRFSEPTDTRYQVWMIQLPSGTTINDPVRFTIWTAMENFDTTKAGSIQADLFEGQNNGTLWTITTPAVVERPVWDAAGDGWIETTFDFGPISHVVSASRPWFGVSVVVNGIVGPDNTIVAEDSMMFAYDSVGFPARLEIGNNTAPVNIVPGAQPTDEDTPLIFSAGNLNQVAISDADVVNNPMRVELKGANGTITLPIITGLTFALGDGSDDANMVFTGTLADINTALDGMRFDPLLNFNGAASIQITTDDLGNSGIGGPLTDVDTVIINVASINDDPVLVNNNVLNLDEGASATITAAELQVTDVDQSAAGILYFLQSVPVNGALNLSGAPLAVFGSFSQEDINLGRVTYVHDDSDNPPTDSFAFFVDDGQGGLVTGLTFDFTINPIDDAPPFQVNNASITVAENASGPISTTELRYDDTEQLPANIRYTLTAGPANGQLELTTAVGTAITTFTQEDIDTGKLIYMHYGGENLSDAFSFDVDDGQSNFLNGQSYSITVTAVNDAPVSTNDTLTIAEDATTVLSVNDFGTYSDAEGCGIRHRRVQQLGGGGAQRCGQCGRHCRWAAALRARSGRERQPVRDHRLQGGRWHRPERRRLHADGDRDRGQRRAGIDQRHADDCRGRHHGAGDQRLRHLQRHRGHPARRGADYDARHRRAARIRHHRWRGLGGGGRERHHQRRRHHRQSTALRARSGRERQPVRHHRFPGGRRHGLQRRRLHTHDERHRGQRCAGVDQ
jgi:hypothetical protein